MTAASEGHVKLVGLDFGTTTSSAVIATARLARNHVTGRREVTDVGDVRESPLVPTPLRDGAIDAARIGEMVEGWLADAGARPEEIFGGGAILTGLCARRANAAEIAGAVRALLRDAVIATAGDPCLESWLTFMGGAAALSRARPDTPVLNVDIGGGTTNLALGLGGRVIRVGSLFIGARHVEVVPGTYRVVHLSDQVRILFEDLGIRKDTGDTLSPAEVAAVVGFYVDLLEATVTGGADIPHPRAAAAHVEVPFRLPEGLGPLLLTFSGGVGALLGHALRDGSLPSPTAYGDLGIDLAAGLARASWPSGRIAEAAHTSRATAYGLLRHQTRISGSTVFLPRPEVLPLSELPIFDRLPVGATEPRIRAALDLVRRSPAGGALAIASGGEPAEAVLGLGKRISGVLGAMTFPYDGPLVILVEDNLAKALGGYVTGWGRLPVHVVVIDEVAVPDAQLVQVGRMADGVLPVSFHGMNPMDGSS